ncbi:MAG: ABC transporter ATP-binding protein [Gemmatimonadota bacterium]|nr:ABC transporter ATP-binding protein [Gemmatimonadota bacterium]
MVSNDRENVRADRESDSGRRTSHFVREALLHRKYAIVAVVALMLAGSAVMLIQPLFFKMLFDTAIPESDTTLAWRLLAVMVATPLVAIGFTYFQGHLRVRIGAWVTLALRKAVLAHLLRVRLDALERIPRGNIVFRVTRDTGRIGELYIAQELLPVFSSSIMLAGTLAMVFVLNVELAVIFCVALPSTYLATRFLSRYSKEMDRQSNEQSKAAESFLYEMASAFRTIRLFNGEAHARRKSGGLFERHTQLKMRGSALHDLVLNFPNEVINGLVLGALLGYGAFQVIDGDITIGSLVAVMAYTPRASAALRSVLMTYTGTKLIDVSVKSLDGLFALPPEAGFGRGRTPERIDLEPPAIAFSNIWFSYDRGYEVKDLSFTVNGGEFVGIVGPSGGGKTTIIDLLTRIQEPERGSISIGGTDIREMTLTSLRSRIAVVPQDVFIWNASLADNIAYPNEKYDMEAVEQSARSSALHAFVEKQPEGYATTSGEGGVALSGGEKQRIAMARVLMRTSAGILVLDEATSALDALAEEEIRIAVEQARVGRTVLVIAHRLSTIRHADRILVISDGRLAESGTPKELVQQGGLFARMYEAQSLDFE